MTQTASFKSKLAAAFSMFKWELRSCSGILTVYSILAAALIFITLSLTVFTNAITDNISYAVDGVAYFLSWSWDASQNTNVAIFQLISAQLVYFLTIIFMIIFTVKIFSYLHNKRKADLYGSMPMGRITMYLSRCATAFVFTVIPSLFFLGIIAIISFCFGQPLVVETSMMFIKVTLGSLACICAYGVFAICCGTSLNTVFMFLITCIAYPLSAMFIKATIRGFFPGFYIGVKSKGTLINALNPLAAYDGVNIIYWIVFSVVCLAIGIILVRKRKFERAQSSFAFYLPAHIIKVLISFIIGMILGCLFGLINLFGMPYVAFLIGFAVGSSVAFLISHLIFYKSFNKLLKTSILLGALFAVVAGLMAICTFDVFNYSSYIPQTDDIESAGYVDLYEYYSKTNTSINNIAKEAADDFTDSDMINNIRTVQSSYVMPEDNTYTFLKFGILWDSLLLEATENDTPEYIFSYKLKDGSTVTRVYTNKNILYYSMLYYVDVDSSYSNYFDYDPYYTTNYITSSNTYIKNYSLIYNYDVEELDGLTVSMDDENSYYDNYMDNEEFEIFINSSEIHNKTTGDSETIAQDFKTIIEAIKQDIDDGKQIGTADVYEYEYTIDIYGPKSLYSQYSSAKSWLGGYYYDYYYDGVMYIRFDDTFTNTIEALKKVGILDENGAPVKVSSYHTYSTSDYY